MKIETFADNDQRKIGIIFSESQINSDLLFISFEDAHRLLIQTKLAVKSNQNNNQTTLFKDGKFAYIRQSSNNTHNSPKLVGSKASSTFLLAISLNEYFSTGKYLNEEELKDLIKQLKRLV